MVFQVNNPIVQIPHLNAKFQPDEWWVDGGTQVSLKCKASISVFGFNDLTKVESLMRQNQESNDFLDFVCLIGNESYFLASAMVTSFASSNPKCQVELGFRPLSCRLSEKVF